MNCSGSRKSLLFAALLVALSVLPIPVHAQDGGDPPAGMEEIAFLAGSWDVSGQVKLNGEWADFTGVATAERSLDDYGLRQEMTGEANGQLIEALSFWTFETYFNAPALIWTDTAVVPNILRSFGQESDNPQVVAFSSDPDTAYRVTLTPINDDTFDLEVASARSITADYEPLWTLHYTRRPDNVAPEDDLFASAEPLPLPPPETEQFAFWVGDWDGSAWVGLEDSEPVEGPASASVRWALGGYALENTYEGPALFGPAKMWGLTRYNPVSGYWEQVWALAPDSGLSRTWEGFCEGDRCEFMGDNFVDIQPDSFQWQHTHGRPEPIWTVDYTRRDSSQDNDLSVAPAYPPEVEEIAFLVGNWDVTGQALTGEESWTDLTGAATFTWALDDHAIHQEWAAVLDGRLVDGVGMWLYNRFRSSLETAWTDTAVLTSIARATGNFQGDHFLAYSRDADAAYNITLTKHSDDSFDWTLATAPSITSDYTPVLRLSYTRRDGDSALDDVRASAEPAPPPTETEQLAFWVGDWDIESQILVEEEWQAAPAAQTVNWVMSGHGLEDWWVGTFFEGASEVWGVTRFDETLGQWIHVRADSRDSGFGYQLGTCAADGTCDIGGDRFFDFREDGFSWLHNHALPPDTNIVWKQEYTRSH